MNELNNLLDNFEIISIKEGDSFYSDKKNAYIEVIAKKN